MLNYIKLCWFSAKLAFIASTCEDGCNLDKQRREIVLCHKHKSEFKMLRGSRTVSRSNHDQWKIAN